jgi:hypothetical protein
MKKMLIIAIWISILCLSSAFAADNPLPDPAQNPEAPFRLFRTTNIWTFIELDTTDGRMLQVQFDINGDKRGSVILNDLPLVNSREQRPGRFTLYPTTNIYNFILLDQINGMTWQVQWAQDPKNRGIIPIPGPE